MSTTARGGYQIVDFKNIGINSSGVTIPGIYEQVSNADKKPCVAVNLAIAVGDTVRYVSGVQFMPAINANGSVLCSFDLVETKTLIAIAANDNVLKMQ